MYLRPLPRRGRPLTTVASFGPTGRGLPVSPVVVVTVRYDWSSATGEWCKVQCGVWSADVLAAYATMTACTPSEVWVVDGDH